MQAAHATHQALVLVASAIQVAFLALDDATIALWALVPLALLVHAVASFVAFKDPDTRPQAQLLVAVANAAVLAAALVEAKELGKDAFALAVAGAGAGLLACPATVFLGAIAEAVPIPSIRNSVLRWYLRDVQIGARLRVVLFPLLLAGAALLLRTRSVSDLVTLVAVVLTGLTALLLVAPAAVLVLGVHLFTETDMHRHFCYVYSVVETLEIAATLTVGTLIWLTHPGYDEDSKADFAGLSLVLSFAVGYIIICCAIYAGLLATFDSELRQYSSKFFRLYMPDLENGDDLWRNIASSPSLTILFQPVLFFLLTFLPTTIVLGESVEEPDECRAGRTALFIDFAAGTVAVGLLCIGVAVEAVKWGRGMIATTVVSLLFTLGFLVYKCFALWLYGYMTCEGRFHFDIRNTVVANEYIYFLVFFVHTIIVAVNYGDSAGGGWWAKFGVNRVYFENYTVLSAVKKVQHQTVLWAAFHGVVIPWEAVAMAKCGADGIEPEAWPYLEPDHTPGGGCKDIPWYPMLITFSVISMLLLLWTTISVRLHRPAILFNTGRSFHYYFFSDLVIHFMILANLALAVGTLVTEPKNRGWGITFTITNTFRLVMVIVDVCAEITMFQDRHQSLADALIEHMTIGAAEATPMPPTHRDEGATTIGYEPPNPLDEFLNFTYQPDVERTSEELRREELRQRVFQKAKRGGQWLRRMRADGSVVWVAAEDLAETSPASTSVAAATAGSNRNGTRPNGRPGSASSSGSSVSNKAHSEHKSSAEDEASADLAMVVPIVKTSSFTPEQETNRLLGTFFCQVQPDASVVWQPGEMLQTVTDVTRGLPGEVTSATLAAVATLPFEEKCTWVRGRLDSMRIPWDQGHQDLYVERANLLSQSVTAMNAVPSGRMRQIFRFHFRGEQGLDAGGVAREWFECVARELFDPNLGLFMFASTDNVSYQIDPRALVTLGEERCKELYYFCGRVMGKALFDNHLLSAHLVRPLYKHLLGVPVGFQDLQFVDDQLYDNMSWVLAEANVHQLELTFTTIEMDAEGRAHERELVPGGAGKVVTDENKLEYVRVSIKHRMFEQQQFALGQMLRGFFDVIPQGLLYVFDAQELELMMCGFDEIDINDWKANTLYEGAFSANHKVIQWFWDILGQLTNQQRTRLLQFVTGTSRVPIGGFKQLQGVDGQVRRFTIRSLQVNEHEYPRSHTCFNRLDLPMYASKAHLESVVVHLTTVEIEGFSMD